MSQLLITLNEPVRARAMAESARTSFVTAGPAAADDLAEVDKFLRDHHWR